MRQVAKLFDGRRLRTDHLHPLTAIVVLAVMMLGQRLAVMELRAMQANEVSVAVTIDIGAPSEYARISSPAPDEGVWAGF